MPWIPKEEPEKECKRCSKPGKKRGRADQSELIPTSVSLHAPADR